MTWRTHLVGGIASLWPLALLPGGLAGTPAGSGGVGVLAAVAAFGALLPDLDAAESKIKSLSLGDGARDWGMRPFALPAVLLHRHFGHRGALHSLLALGVLVLLTLPLSLRLGWQAQMALSLGYSSHLLLDACTPRGVPLLWPDRRARHALPRSFRIPTGSPEEGLVFALLANLAVLLLLSKLLQRTFSTGVL